MEIFAKEKRGFTLIELLVVIAIIGILAAIVLISLQGARERARDGRIIADMSQMRTVSEIYYGAQTPNSYTGLCADADIGELQTDVGDQGGTSPSCQVETAAAPNPGQSFCIEVELNNGQYWCVDSVLTSRQYGASTCAGCEAANTVCECG